MLFSYGVMASVRQNSILDLVWSGYDTVFTLINVVAIFVLVLPYKHQGALGKVVTLVGKNSLGIYFIHIIIGSLLEPYYKPMAFSATLGMNVGYTMVILFSSLLAVWALRKIPVVRSLFIV
nr:hypothetical protein [Rufibacter roseolus]